MGWCGMIEIGQDRTGPDRERERERDRGWWVAAVCNHLPAAAPSNLRMDGVKLGESEGLDWIGLDWVELDSNSNYESG